MKRRPITNLATDERAYVTPPELATYLHCDARTILRMIESGALPAVRVGRNWRVRTAVARQTFHEEQTSEHIA